MLKFKEILPSLLIKEEAEELSDCQKKYADYFLKTLKKHKAEDMSDFDTDEKKSEFFNDIRDGWDKSKCEPK